ncbi:MAG: nitroreductase family deazaflavin-dependent oxidoreductase [Micrococcales bacterium]|nr:nitroreductase family deazaflavin-dependent oxidoreductase [Micrococcales bacterium]
MSDSYSWATAQANLFERTAGAEGGTLQGAPIVVVTTIGAKSGTTRKVPVMRVEHDGTYAVVASKGGAPQHPAWYHNLVAHPQVRLQDGPTTRDYVARETSGAERNQWWVRAVEAWPAYADYQRRTARVIPVFVLQPV